MSVSEAQLATWSNVGPEATAAQTHATIRLALERIQQRAGNRPVDIYLQGSYRNKTNIYGDSDVDIVCELQHVFEYDVSSLSQNEIDAFNREMIYASYTFSQFRQAVLDGLRDRFGNAVKSRNKCIEIAAGPGRIQADVIPCLDYRVYRTTRSNYIEGIVFYDQQNSRKIVNYPKLHIDNGWSKNSETRANSNYKPLIRVFKNWRNKQQSDKLLTTDAPSYFIECLLYNVPDAAFLESTYKATVLAILNFLHSADLKTFWCQNGMVRLCGTTPEQWTETGARSFINACIKAWNE